MRLPIKMQTILIVDDESQIRTALEGVLADEGYKTLLAESGEECLEILRPQIRRRGPARHLVAWTSTDWIPWKSFVKTPPS